MVFVLAALLAFPPCAAADLSWLEQADSCEMFAKGLAENFGSATPADFTPEQRAELRIILREACGERFKECGFSICGLAKDKTGEAIVTDPLAWLAGDLTCDQLIEQIKARYNPLGRYSELPESKKGELREVMDVACGPRFAACRFKACERKHAKERAGKDKTEQLVPAGPAVMDAPPNPPAVALTAAEPPAVQEVKTKEKPEETPQAAPRTIAQQAEEELARRIETLAAERTEMIAAAEAREAEGNLQWDRLGNAEELEMINARKQKSSEKKPPQKMSGASSSSGAPVWTKPRSKPVKAQVEAKPAKPASTPPVRRPGGGRFVPQF